MYNEFAPVFCSPDRGRCAAGKLLWPCKSMFRAQNLLRERTFPLAFHYLWLATPHFCRLSLFTVCSLFPLVNNEQRHGAPFFFGAGEGKKNYICTAA
jgi:hypothetical protein